MKRQGAPKAAALGSGGKLFDIRANLIKLIYKTMIYNFSETRKRFLTKAGDSREGGQAFKLLLKEDLPMMIDRNELEILANYQNTENPVVSLYLNITPPRNYENELNSMIHTTLREIEQEARYTDKQIKRLKKLMEKIEDYVAKAFNRFERTWLVALFADADGFWQEYYLPVNLPSSMVVEVDPYTRPMTLLLDEFDRYCVVVGDSRKARIFSLYLGDFEEFPDVFIEDNVPDGVRVKQSMTAGGGTVMGGLGDKRIERHIEDHVHRHLKKVVEEALNQNTEVQHVFAGHETFDQYGIGARLRFTL